MSKSDRKDDGFYSKAIIAAIVVIWVSLVGGNWLGHYVVEKNLLGKSAKQEYNASVITSKPKPWITVDPAQQQALERMQSTQREEKPVVVETSVPVATETEAPAETVSPVPEAPVVEAPAPDVTPLAADTSAPAPTPTAASTSAEGGLFHLQYGSFGAEENAKAHAESLSALGIDVRVEEIDTGTGKKVFLVRGGDTTEEQARQQRDKLREQNIDSYLQNSH